MWVTELSLHGKVNLILHFLNWFSHVSVFAPASKRDCIERFGQRTTKRIIHDSDIICTTEYSRIVPLENGEVWTQKLCPTLALALWPNFLAYISVDELIYYSLGIIGMSDFLWFLNPSHTCSDCGVSGEWTSRRHELLLLSGSEGVYQGHQHPPALPAHQHAAGSPDGQSPERPHGHTKSKIQFY